MKIAVLISGGVDSAVVVHKLVEEGHDLQLFYIQIGMDDDEGDCEGTLSTPRRGTASLRHHLIWSCFDSTIRYRWASYGSKQWQTERSHWSSGEWRGQFSTANAPQDKSVK